MTGTTAIARSMKNSVSSTMIRSNRGSYNTLSSTYSDHVRGVVDKSPFPFGCISLIIIIIIKLLL